MLGFLTMGLFANSGGSALLGMCLVELAIAFLDVMVDGIVVERARHEAPEKAGSLQSICWGFQVGLHVCVPGLGMHAYMQTCSE